MYNVITRGTCQNPQLCICDDSVQVIPEITQYLAHTAWPFFTVTHLRYSTIHQNVMYRLEVRQLLCNILPRMFYKQNIFDIFCNKGKSTNIKGKPELYITQYTFQRTKQRGIWLITLCVCVCVSFSASTTPISSNQLDTKRT